MKGTAVIITWIACAIARGELNETLAHFAHALVLAYIEQEYYNEIHALIRKTEATLNGFMNYVRKQRTGAVENRRRQTGEEIECCEAPQD